MRRKREDDYKKLLPLKRIAEASSYSLGYVSILVQRKKPLFGFGDVTKGETLIQLRLR